MKNFNSKAGCLIARYEISRQSNGLGYLTPDFTRYLFANVGRLLGSLIGPPEKGATAEAAERPGGQKKKVDG